MQNLPGFVREAKWCRAFLPQCNSGLLEKASELNLPPYCEPVFSPKALGVMLKLYLVSQTMLHLHASSQNDVRCPLTHSFCMLCPSSHPGAMRSFLPEPNPQPCSMSLHIALTSATYPGLPGLTHCPQVPGKTERSSENVHCYFSSVVSGAVIPASWKNKEASLGPLGD